MSVYQCFEIKFKNDSTAKVITESILQVPTIVEKVKIGKIDNITSIHKSPYKVILTLGDFVSNDNNEAQLKLFDVDCALDYFYVISQNIHTALNQSIFHCDNKKICQIIECEDDIAVGIPTSFGHLEVFRIG